MQGLWTKAMCYLQVLGFRPMFKERDECVAASDSVLLGNWLMLNPEIDHYQELSLCLESPGQLAGQPTLNKNMGELEFNQQ